jgi:predicted PurR-regulated permease PerM
LFAKLDEFSKSLSTTLPSILISVFSTAISSIGTFIIGMVIGFYLLISCNNLGNNIMDFIPRRFRKNIKKLSRNINKSLRNYVNGALIDAGVVFLISSIIFAIIGLKAPLLFGLFCGIMNVIPYAGPYIGGAPAVIVGFSQGIGVGIAVLFAVIIIQMVEGNILQTLIISKTTKLNPVIIIIGLLIFGHFFGIIGMLLSTPIISVIKVIITYFDDKYDILNFE